MIEVKLVYNKSCQRDCCFFKYFSELINCDQKNSLNFLGDKQIVA